MDASQPEHFATQVDEHSIRAAHERLDAVAHGLRNDPNARQALDMLLRDMKTALVSTRSGKRTVLLRAIARHERGTLRIADPGADT